MGDIAFLAHRIPFPPDRGDKIRSFNILRHLARSHRVHLACFADDAADAAHLAGLREALGGQLVTAHVEIRPRNRRAAVRALAGGRPVSVALFSSPSMQAFVDNLLADHDVTTIFAFSGQMAQYVPAGARQRFIMDFVDMDSAKFAQYGATGSGPMAWLYRREGRKLLAFEQAVARRADTSLFVTEAEARLFRARCPDAGDVRALENGIDLGFYDPVGAFARHPRSREPLILFTGQMDYRPNVEAVTSFAQCVMPLVRRTQPDARFAIVGRKPTPAVQRLDGLHGTQVIGAVADVRSWLAAADVVVAPLTIARGIQNKVLEAMAMARPVVATPQAFEGIDAWAGRELMVEDSSEGLAKAVLSLLANPDTAQALGEAGRRRVAQGYGWDAKLAALDALLDRLSERAAA